MGNLWIGRFVKCFNEHNNFIIPSFCVEADEDEPAVVAAVETPAATKVGGKKRLKLINQFNYCERAALTYNNPSRV